MLGTLNVRFLEDQHGAKVYISDTLLKYDHTVFVYSSYKNAKKGKKIRLSLEKKCKNSSVKIFEVAYLEFIPKLARGLLKKNMSFIKRQILLDFKGEFKKNYNLDTASLNVLIFQKDSLISILKDPDVEKIKDLISQTK